VRHEIAKAPELVDALAAGGAEDSIERSDIAVDVREDSNSHLAGPASGSRREADPPCRSGRADDSRSGYPCRVVTG
jgi:hypothetical protein